jgi:hypothetical protein
MNHDKSNRGTGGEKETGEGLDSAPNLTSHESTLRFRT